MDKSGTVTHIWSVATHETQNRRSHPGYWAVQLRLTSHQWGPRFVRAFKCPSGALRPRISEILKPHVTRGIFKSFRSYLVILSLTPLFYSIVGFGVHFVPGLRTPRRPSCPASRGRRGGRGGCGLGRCAGLSRQSDMIDREWVANTWRGEPQSGSKIK